ncbi:vitamin K epoxide reductase family protein [Patescibacteria group bacterium]|nr:MAG: vitamin K epoxide reductase family protein [Patescibacteria group bacterium]
MTSPLRYIDWIIALAFVGVLLSMYSLLHKTGFTSGAICNLSDTFSCDIVNQGSYSEIFDIPVAGIGVAGYLFVFIAALLKRKNPADRSLSLFLLVATTGGFLFALYLTGLEAFVLFAWCIVCLTSQILIASLAGLSFLNYRSERV